MGATDATEPQLRSSWLQRRSELHCRNIVNAPRTAIFRVNRHQDGGRLIKCPIRGQIQERRKPVILSGRRGIAKTCPEHSDFDNVALLCGPIYSKNGMYAAR